MKIQKTLIAKGIKVSKVYNSEKEAVKFERDMPAKFGLLFSCKPYLIQTKEVE